MCEAYTGLASYDIYDVSFYAKYCGDDILVSNAKILAALETAVFSSSPINLINLFFTTNNKNKMVYKLFKQKSRKTNGPKVECQKIVKYNFSFMPWLSTSKLILKLHYYFRSK